MLILFNFSEMAEQAYSWRKYAGCRILKYGIGAWASFKGLGQVRLPPVLQSVGAARFGGIVMVWLRYHARGVCFGGCPAPDSTETAFSVLVFLEDRGIPARLDSLRHRRHSGAGRANNFRVDVAKTPRSSTIRVWRGTGWWFFSTRPG